MIAVRIAALVLVLAANPKAPQTTIEKANNLVSAMKHVEAEALLRSAMKKSPGAHGYRLALGRVHVAKGDPGTAYLEMLYEGLRAGSDPSGAAAFDAADQLLQETRGPELVDGRRVRDAYEAVRDRPADATRILGEVSKVHRSHFVVRFFLAEARMRSGDHEPALKQLRALSAEDPWFVPSVVLEAMTLRAIGRQKEAEAAAAKARKLAPNHWALKPLDLLADPLPEPTPTPSPTPLLSAPVP